MAQRLAEGLAPSDQQRRQRIGRQAVGIAGDEQVQRVMHDLAAFRRARVGVERVERAQFQDTLGIERVRVAPPQLDRRD